MRIADQEAHPSTVCSPNIVIDFASVTDLSASAALHGFIHSTNQLSGEERIVMTLDAALPLAVRSQRPWILVSDNPCPEFVEDWWDRGAIALLRTSELACFSRVLAVLRTGARFRIVKPYDRLLTRCERQVLQLKVHGYSVDEIAEQLGKSVRTARDQEMNVRDKLRARYTRLRLRKAQHLVHYYHGRWSLLEGLASSSLISGDTDAEGV